MKIFFKLTVVACAFMLLLPSCETKPKEQKIYVLSTNDMHANIDNFPKMAALIDSLRAVHPDLLLFSAGDNRSGNPINDRYVEDGKLMPARPMYELMESVHFDLSCFGNHEWDGGPIALRNVLGWAKFPFVCANVTFDDTLQMPNVHPYVIFQRDGLKIGVIGGIQLGENGLPDFHPKNAGGSHFVPLDEVLPTYIEELKDCNAVFLLTHCGYEEDRETAEKFPQIAAIFGGHSHTRVADRQLVNGVMVTQAEAKVKYLTLSTFTFSNGILAYGPYPSDGFFGSSEFSNFDGALALYHDQGLIPFKLMSFTDGVNYTAGLDIIRTSPAHGTAYDIAGKGKASEQSFRHAVYLACDIMRHRREYDELTADPLK